MRRWNKKRWEKRRSMLKAVVPDLCQRRWPLPYYRYNHFNQPNAVQTLSTVQQDQLLLPWLNVEVLVKNAAVLCALLHYRSAEIPLICGDTLNYFAKVHFPGFNGLGDGSCYNAFVTTQLAEEISNCWQWSWIRDECQHVKKIHGRFQNAIRQGQALPVEYDKAIGALELLLMQVVVARAKDFNRIVHQRPGFSSNWTVEARLVDG
ncbi:hypothetical protein AJ79_02485 [Helicocarpus griseus UAMH5409]|uniref:Uncharacterized protein n=1 Tax=Helicocarpus griseus UAMH5409 TaxID=1447875 RepID=A0A2B7Y216_9EURO|nr:hypothetical protein AJ79_02485 [Helicocarpus griseus UAMH5409]